MADIHIGKVTEKGQVREVELLFHITVNNPVAGIIPSATSSMEAKLDQQEIDALGIGTLVEKRQTIALQPSLNLSDQDVQEKIKQIWSNLAGEFNTRFDKEYANYGDTVSAT